MLASGSDRIGALDFQASATDYRPRHGGEATLAELERAAQALQDGAPLPPAIVDALAHGTSIGGARSKALLSDGGRQLIAKLSSSSDRYPVLKGEYLAMTLARQAGLDAAAVELIEANGRDVLLIERFDRPGAGERRLIVSALTLLGLEEIDATRRSSYADLASVVRARFVDPLETTRELFGRLVFNVLCSDGWRFSQLAACVARAGEYLPVKTAQADARVIIDHQVETICAGWDDACDRARLTARERDHFWGRQFSTRTPSTGIELRRSQRR